MVSNINWYMNVPVEPDGTLGIVDGLSARGCRSSLRAEIDVLVLVSNCPQINNPCNGFDPTPVRMIVDGPREPSTRCLVANRGEIAVRIIRIGDATWACGPSRCSPTPTAARRTSRLADEAVRLGPAPGARELPRGRRRSSTPRARTGRRRDPPRLRVPVRGRGLRARRARPRGSPSSGRRPSSCELFGAKHTRPRAGPCRGRAVIAGTGLLADVDEALDGRRRRSATR